MKNGARTIVLTVAVALACAGCDSGDYDLIRREEGAAAGPASRLANAGTFSTDSYRRFDVNLTAAPVDLLLDSRSGRTWYRRQDSLEWLPVRIVEPDSARFEYSPLYDLPPADSTWEGIDRYDNIANRFTIAEEFEPTALLLDRKWGRTWHLSEMEGWYWWIPIPMEERDDRYYYSPVQTIN